MTRTVALLVTSLLVPSIAHAASGWGVPVNLGPNVNSPGDEYGVTVAADGVTIYFDSDGLPGLGGKDLYTSTFDGSVWDTALNLGFDVNTTQREYAPAISPDGQTLMFTSEGWNIHMATGGAGAWGARVPIPGAVNTADQEWAPRFVDDTTIMFTGYERTGGFGAEAHDLFTSTLSLGQWMTPVLFDISTLGDEYAGFIAAGGDSAFLVRNGDIWMSRFQGGVWQPPLPIPGLVNTDEFYETSPALSPDGLRLYFTSERSDGQGGYDIWYSDWSDDIVAVDEPVAARFGLSHARPNPFNPRTTITFDLDSDHDRVVMSIYDVAGRRLRTLFDGPAPAGATDVVWDGRDDAGRALPSGTYLYRLHTDGESRTRKMSLVR